LDELFELLTLRQTGKMTKSLPVVLYDSKFWNGTIKFQNFVDAKLISSKDLDLFTFADTPEQAWSQLLARGLVIPKD
jgi:predicted Rossmann-fold nucleotide-binding protein